MKKHYFWFFILGSIGFGIFLKNAFLTAEQEEILSEAEENSGQGSGQLTSSDPLNNPKLQATLPGVRGHQQDLQRDLASEAPAGLRPGQRVSPFGPKDFKQAKFDPKSTQLALQKRNKEYFDNAPVRIGADQFILSPNLKAVYKKHFNSNYGSRAFEYGQYIFYKETTGTNIPHPGLPVVLRASNQMMAVMTGKFLVTTDNEKNLGPILSKFSLSTESSLPHLKSYILEPHSELEGQQYLALYKNLSKESILSSVELEIIEGDLNVK